MELHKRCPFPDVAESLQPYIKPRQEVSNTREAVQRQLPLSPWNVAQPPPLERLNAFTLGGVRKAYWRALQAHNAAQANYDALKTELTQMNNEPSSLTADDSSTFLTESYVPLMRQRERRRKLVVLENTFARARSCGGDAIGDSFDKVAKREVGELPGPPSTSALSDHEPGSGSDYDLHKLKKAILTTRQQLHKHESTAPSDSNGAMSEQVDPHADLRGLQKAHIELTTWMETQLAIISNVETPKEGETIGSASPRSTDSGQFSMRDIEALYDQYLDTRERLLHLVSNPAQQPQADEETLEGAQRGVDVLETDQSALASEALLPHLSKLLSSKQQEQDLLQQGAYTRRQIASAESQVHAVIARLADESHLVQPDVARRSPSGKDWARAATGASAATFTSSMQRLRSGHAATDAAGKALKIIEGMPASLDSLV